MGRYVFEFIAIFAVTGDSLTYACIPLAMFVFYDCCASMNKEMVSV
jgi:hypothetical protein